MQIVQGKHFLNMRTFQVFDDPCIYQLYLKASVLPSDSTWSSSFGLTILTLFSGRFVLINKISGRNFLRRNSSNLLYSASCTVLVPISEYAFVSLYHVHWNKGFLSPLHQVLVLSRLHLFALNTFLLWKLNHHIYQCLVVVMYWLNIEVLFPCFK